MQATIDTESESNVIYKVMITEQDRRLLITALQQYRPYNQKDLEPVNELINELTAPSI